MDLVKIIVIDIVNFTVFIMFDNPNFIVFNFKVINLKVINLIFCLIFMYFNLFYYHQVIIL